VVSANSQEADPLKQKLARRGDGELSKQIHQSNQILQIFQAGTGNACNWTNCGIETKGKIVYDCSLGKIFILSRKSSRRVFNRENEKGEKKKKKRLASQALMTKFLVAKGKEFWPKRRSRREPRAKKEEQNTSE